jgi:hypothetical protein
MEHKSRSLGTDAAELESVIRDTAEEQAEIASRELAKKYHPSQVPYLDDSYTFGDRQNELELLENLLSFKLADVRNKLTVVREINHARSYPSIAFQDPKE